MKPATGRVLTLLALAAGLDGGLPDLGERADDRPWPDPLHHPPMPTPLDVACPRCGVDPGVECCKAPGRYRFHKARVDALAATPASSLEAHDRGVRVAALLEAAEVVSSLEPSWTLSEDGAYVRAAGVLREMADAGAPLTQEETPDDPR